MRAMRRAEGLVGKMFGQVVAFIQIDWSFNFCWRTRQATAAVAGTTL